MCAEHALSIRNYGARRTAGFDEIVARDALPPVFDLHCEMIIQSPATGQS